MLTSTLLKAQRLLPWKEELEGSHLDALKVGVKQQALWRLLTSSWIF